jgi:hypothetical protein
MRGKERGPTLAILGPLILTADLVLLLWGKVVLDVKGLADLLGRLALDHVRNGLAANVEKSFDVKVIGSLVGESVMLLWWRKVRKHTKMISKSISWSTCIYF